jgi:hypothetical protein
MHIILYATVYKLRITELLILIARKWKEMGMIQIPEYSCLGLKN